MSDDSNPFRSPEKQQRASAVVPTKQRRSVASIILLLTVIVGAIAGSYGYVFPAIALVCGAILLSLRMWREKIDFGDGA
jgi:hypothetical protein